MNLGYIRLVVFVGGIVTLGAELSASRLIAPFFGTSLVVWSSLIGLILIALSIGNWIGGRWVDRSHSAFVFIHLQFIGALLVGLIPVVSRPVLHASLEGIANFNAGVLAGSLVGVLILMGIPMILLGCLSPYAIGLATRDASKSGRISGQIFALSTLGSVLGCFLPVLVLIPEVGTRWTFCVLSLFLFTTAAIGYIRAGALRGVIGVCIAVGVICGLIHNLSAKPLKPGDHLVFESESPYQYVRVVTNNNGWVYLKLNEGVVTHSRYHPQLTWTFGLWDYFSVAPFFNPAPFDPTKSSKKWAMIGSAAGTGARLISKLYPDAEIQGVELDGDVVQAGYDYFDMAESGMTVDVADGRGWLRLNEDRFDVIVVDAYKQPYIPFELTTAEFFQEMDEHLTESGVVAINVARPAEDDRLVNALATTMNSVFPKVFLLNLPKQNMTTLMIGVRHNATLADFEKNVATAPMRFNFLIHQARKIMSDSYEQSRVLTDDLAPVERLMDQMIFGYMLNAAGQ